jgi:hypothetical protein
LALAACAALGLLLFPFGGTLAAEPLPEPEDAACTLAPETTPGCVEMDALPIEPDGTVSDPQPQGWDHVVVGPDGRTLDVYFWMGVRHCHGLHSVEVTPTESGIDLTLMTGVPVGAEGMVCVALATEYVTTVPLDAPLIGNAG